ncbi:DinB family protein [Hymenobacter weizhouensis]|uniref:DinB family protein n=1 Tax=Hymenobacter sp. YIM 151500-1 TaxID=2987689 RepID=UPI002225BADC|nr:DinB family protein [Hymenobacter sp. YIM 151500-1]UYZ61863.1 DinB family protein [Hymenobacter sp. YIM 151500-1]
MNTLPASSLTRLQGQYETVFQLLAEVDPALLTRRPASGKWSIHENLAHIGTYQATFLARMQRMQVEDTPQFARYVADEDPTFAPMVARPPAEVQQAFRELRQPLLDYITSLTPTQLARPARHPVYGHLTGVAWVEFFLLHETHHLFTMFRLLGELSAPPQVSA